MNTIGKLKDELVHKLYGAVLSPTGWAEAMSALSQILQTVNAHLMLWDATSPTLLHSAHVGIDQLVQDKYEAHYASIDPRLRHAANLNGGDWFNCAQVFDTRWVNQDEFYQDFLIPAEIRWLLGSRLIHHQGLNVYFGVHRAPGQQPFEEADLAWVRGITPHFQQAVQLWLTTQSLRQQAVLGERGLNALEHGVIMTNQRGLLVHANPQAESMLRAGWPLRLRSGRLHLASNASAPDTSLSTALQVCTRTRQPQWLSLGKWGDLARPLCTITLLSLAEDSVLRAPPVAAEVILLLSHTRHRRQATVTQLMAQFGLTPAEARLACALVKGDGLDTYAQSAGISINTARTQLQATFQKTGTRSQTDLLRLLMMQPSGRPTSI